MNIKYNIVATDEVGMVQKTDLNFQEALDFLIERRAVAALTEIDKLNIGEDICADLDSAVLRALISKSYKHSEQQKEDENNARKYNLRLGAKFIIEKLKAKDSNSKELLENLEWIYKELNNENNEN